MVSAGAACGVPLREKRWTRQELVAMDRNEFRMLDMLLSVGAFNLLGLGPRVWTEISRDPINGDLVIRWLPREAAG